MRRDRWGVRGGRYLIVLRAIDLGYCKKLNEIDAFTKYIIFLGSLITAPHPLTSDNGGLTAVYLG
jgi:hypothetical protein